MEGAIGLCKPENGGCNAVAAKVRFNPSAELLHIWDIIIEDGFFAVETLSEVVG